MKSTPGFEWTTDAMDRLRTMAAAGDSATKIGLALGCSRNAVIGKIHRAQGKAGSLQKRATKPALPQTIKIERRVRIVRSPPLAPQVEIRCASDIIVVPMDFARAVAEDRCLFFAADPMSIDGPDMPVCGCPRADRLLTRYCEAHLASHGRAV